MRNLEKVADRIEEELSQKDKVRERALKSSRTVVRMSGTLLQGLYSGHKNPSELDELNKEVSNLSDLLAENPELSFTGYVETALQEYSELGIITRILEKDDFPTPEELHVPSVAYLLGLGDSVGELRRLCLEELKAGRTEQADHFLSLMEKISAVLMRFDFPEAIVPIRRKQDVARSLIEKTRGDVAVATTAKRLQEKLEEVLRKD